MIHKKGRIKIVVLDDDPTGIQAVSGCLMLTAWTPELIRDALNDTVDFFFILTNTRALSADDAVRRVAVVMHTVIDVNEEYGYRLLFVSRSDSTLRGHFPQEIDVMKRAYHVLYSLSVDGVFFVPAFFEGGRVTAGNIHYVIQDGVRIPAAKTEFAADPVFGYSSSDLRKYIEEKTGGETVAAAVRSVSLFDLRHSSMNKLCELLIQVNRGVYVIVNAEGYSDLDRFSRALRKTTEGGKNFLIRGGASIVKSLANIPDSEPLDGSRLTAGDKPGIIIVGSYVERTTRQLKALLADSAVRGIEIDVLQVPEQSDNLIEKSVREAGECLDQGITPVLYTSRTEKECSSPEKRLMFGKEASRVLCTVVKAIRGKAGFIIAKGGITSADILTQALEIDRTRVLGQLIKGVPVVRTPPGPGIPSIPFVIFPGNVGENNSLLSACRRMLHRAED